MLGRRVTWRCSGLLIRAVVLLSLLVFAHDVGAWMEVDG